ncbi:MAG: LysE family transporter [Chlamydiia bacterium]|nr:LysE family transporter [Chlamydiia bacterium]
MPIGPVGLVCVQQTLLRGLLFGLFAGVGTAIADACFGGIAACGVNLVGTFLLAHRHWFQVAAALLLIGLGLNALCSKAPRESEQVVGGNPLMVMGTTFALSLCNPMVLVCFAGFYAGLGIDPLEQGISAAALLTFGVFMGAVIWWVLLTSLITYFRQKLPTKASETLQKFSGNLFLGLGLITLLTVLL